VILDLYSRRVVGWAMSDQIDEPLVLSALHMALQTRRPEPGLIHHSDRGSQYCSTGYLAVLQAHGIVRSMSRKADCFDNAVSESFFGTLKQELLYRRQLDTRAQTQTAIFEYLEAYFNPKRRHSTLGFLSPIEFERRERLAVSTV
jgi:transposase InsO family protein